MSLISYTVKRILSMIVVMFGALTLTFVLSRFMPGDPVLAYLPQNKPNPQLYAYYTRLLGLDRPIWEQYFRYIGDLFTGNWGFSVSIAKDMPVWTLIMQRLPRTVDITILSVVIASFLGIKFGIISAKHRNKTRDAFFRGLSLVGVAVPVFFLGMLLQYFFAYQLKWFPGTGFKTREFPDPAFVTGFRVIDALISRELYIIFDYLYHLVLPVFCLSFISLAGIVRQTRSSMLEVLEQDYIRTARAKGCRERDVINTHAKKNAMIPTVTIIGLSFAGLLAGAVLTETTFDLKGVGQLLVDAIVRSDYWVLNGLVFFFTIVFVVANLLVDLLYGVLDPRIRY
ncbi:MAG: ABC transporter permease subunit [Candidatus Lokiarchaeota archaeon]|nr:ABC transporter permease subunit [Candidatus Lokiarchaeota archaeon]MBD3200507.1 ABC transporter permease subunit [Candidatus Lokiarchaeota archaeon]